jgi:ubiquinone/menaquinone biosynthesis C-methylase UbiE
MTTRHDTSSQGYLPFAVPANFKADYLRLVMQHGGMAASAYKKMSFDLLELGSGMRVLDVGCGVGIDLPSLADLVGPEGEVIGLERDPDLVQEARQTIVPDGCPNLRIVQGDAEQMPFADAEYDRVRADRALQHIQQPAQAMAEMWRVIRPGGILTLVEPDWRAMALYPGSPTGGDDDRTFQRILQYYQQRLPHALIGRQLHALLHRQRDAWKEIQVLVISFSLTSWTTVDTVLQISTVAHALMQEDPTHASEIAAWLHTVEAATREDEFFASIPLFFASAQR